jgi:hypothetical protein
MGSRKTANKTMGRPVGPALFFAEMNQDSRAREDG